ncbi:MAG: S41 family peptidase [Gloeomargaritaceae cyanobacterium C42_A2020_066]|nr:S41 family peptidase [Gloeomargaritaceae cyanobacterium C42_A2020_066]
MIGQGLVLATTAVSVGAVALTVVGLHTQSWAGLTESPKELVDEVWQVVYQNYVDPSFNKNDWRQVRRQYLSRSYTSKEQAYGAIREMLERLEDPYTRFMEPEQFQSMRIDTSGELTGVGIQLAQDEKTKQLVVISPIEDTPAARAGILAQDVIVKINDKSTQGMDINQAVALIRGKAGTTVQLTIRRGERQAVYTLKRERIELHAVRSEVQESRLGKLGYIRLTQFNGNASADMRKAIEDLEKQQVVGYILDLRSNPGGLLQSSVEIADMWLDRGTIVSTKTRVGEAERYEARRSTLTNKPLVVLVDGGSASASEILAGALQDNQRAVLVGTKTFGKGLVQSVRELQDGSGLAVTIAKYYTPAGRNINKEGINPNVEISLTDEQREAILKNRAVGTPQDPQYARALEALSQLLKVATKEGRPAAPASGT